MANEKRILTWSGCRDQARLKLWQVHYKQLNFLYLYQKHNAMVVAKISKMAVTRIQCFLQSIQGTPDWYLRLIVLSNLSKFHWPLGNTEIHRWSDYVHCWREYLGFLGNERHTVLQEPWALTWNIYDACLLRQLDQAKLHDALNATMFQTKLK